MKKLAVSFLAVASLTTPPKAQAMSEYCVGVLTTMSVTAIVAGVFHTSKLGPPILGGLIAQGGVASLICMWTRNDAVAVLENPKQAVAKNEKFRVLVETIGMIDAIQAVQMVADSKPAEETTKYIETVMKNGPLS